MLDQFHHFFVGRPDGIKTVFLHGLLGAAANWRTIAKSIELDHYSLCYDQRGHGRSIKPKKGHSPEDFANDLRAILDELGWDKIQLVGHSMGGRNAINFASRFPDRVERLVIEDIGPDANPQALIKFEKMFARIPTPFPTKIRAKEFLLNEFGDPTLGMYLYTNIEDRPDGRSDWRFSVHAMLETVREGRAVERWDEWEKLSMPTLLIRGELTDELPPDMYQRMLDSNSNALGVEIPGAGHWVHSDKPQEFIAALKKFL